jgi:hypothetical protein
MLNPSNGMAARGQRAFQARSLNSALRVGKHGVKQTGFTCVGWVLTPSFLKAE